MCRSRFSGLAVGDEARVVVAAVDVGILNLTNYKPPSADDYYLGQQALSAEIRDLYGQLIDGMQGARGEIRSGGDEGAQLQGSPPTGPPVALYSGIGEGRCRRQRRSGVRCRRLCRHASRDGGGVEQGPRSAMPAPTSSFAIRSCSRRRCHASSSRATARRCISISTMSRVRPATTPSPSPAPTRLRRTRHRS